MTRLETGPTPAHLTAKGTMLPVNTISIIFPKTFVRLFSLQKCVKVG